MFIVFKKFNKAEKTYLDFKGIRFFTKKTKPKQRQFNYLFPSISLQCGLDKKTKYFLVKKKTPIHFAINKSYFNLSSSFNFNQILTSFNICNLYNKNNIKFLWLVELNSLVRLIYSSTNLNFLYKAGYGNYLILWKKNIKKNKAWLYLPSKQILTVDYWDFCLEGFELFTKRNKYISKFLKTNFRKKKKSVRGVAMNAFNHLNGGSSNRKPLFYNKYNKIAKHNK